MLQEMLEVQHGIWIDEELVRGAGLGGHLQVIVTPGEIRILPGESESQPKGSAKGWDVFRALGNDAPKVIST